MEITQTPNPAFGELQMRMSLCIFSSSPPFQALLYWRHKCGSPTPLTTGTQSMTPPWDPLFSFAQTLLQTGRHLPPLGRTCGSPGTMLPRVEGLFCPFIPWFVPSRNQVSKLQSFPSLRLRPAPRLSQHFLQNPFQIPPRAGFHDSPVFPVLNLACAPSLSTPETP